MVATGQQRLGIVLLGLGLALGPGACGPFEPFDCEPDWAEADCQARCREDPAMRAAMGRFSKLPVDDPCSLHMTCHGCGDDFRFVMERTQFADLEVLSVFPAHVPAVGPAIRVCGPPLAGDANQVVNGLEFQVGLVSDGPHFAPCDGPAGQGDRDRSVREGDRIDLQRVTSSGQGAGVTVLPAFFSLHVDGNSPRHSRASHDAALDLLATTVRNDQTALRCDPKRPDSWQNVALLVDHTGSLSGLVDGETLLEDDPAKVEPILPIGAQTQSDPFNTRIGAVEYFLSLLNNQDSAGVWYFDEKIGVDVACSDSYVCEGGPRDGEKCLMAGKNEDCPFGACIDDLFDQWHELPRAFSGPGDNRQNHCFGKLDHPFRRDWFRNGLHRKAKHAGEGRAPLWHAVHAVFDFLSGTAADGNAGAVGPKHIVVLTDGPDTCTESEHFTHRDLTATAASSTCRTP